jgi:hypothetical protein
MARRPCLLVPGFTYTGMMKRFLKEKPPAAWFPEQVADFLFEAMGRGDFYVLCPGNEVTSDVDHRRIEWAAGDITENRPALSRWHPEYAAAFEEFMLPRDCPATPAAPSCDRASPGVPRAPFGS